MTRSRSTGRGEGVVRASLRRAASGSRLRRFAVAGDRTDIAKLARESCHHTVEAYSFAECSSAGSELGCGLRGTQPQVRRQCRSRCPWRVLERSSMPGGRVRTVVMGGPGVDGHLLG